MRSVDEDFIIIRESNLSISIPLSSLQEALALLRPILSHFSFFCTDITDKQPLCISSYLILSENLDMTQLKSIEGYN